MEYGTVAHLKSTVSAAAMGMATNGWLWFVTDALGNTGVVPTIGPSTLLVRSRTYVAHTMSGNLNFEMLSFNSELREEYLGEAAQEGATDGALPPIAPTSQPPPPGTTPSSPASGVSGGNAPPPSPLSTPGQRYIHSSSLVRSDRGESIFDNQASSPYDSDYDEEDVARKESHTIRRAGQDMSQLGQALYPLFCISVHEHAWMSAGYGVWGKEQWLKEFWSVLDWKKVSDAYDRYVNTNQVALKAKGRAY
jgi:superoxide dismutase, Fe-Mn family